MRERSRHVEIVGHRLISQQLPERGPGLHQPQLRRRNVLLELEFLKRQFQVISFRQIARHHARMVQIHLLREIRQIVFGELAEPISPAAR